MKHNITYYILLAALVLTACSNDDDLTGLPISDNSSIISFGLNSGGWQNGRPDTRAAQIDVGAPTTAQPNNIGVWGYYMTAGAYGRVGDAIPNDYKVADIKEGGDKNKDYYKTLSNYELRYVNSAHNNYHYSLGTADINNPSGSFPWEAQKYMFYCYAPHESNIEENSSTSYKMSASFGSGGNYDNFTINNVPSISNTDIVIAKQRRPWYRLQNANEPSVGYGACVNFTDDGYELQHLYAAVQFCFTLNKKYADIRYLHIKKVEITTEEALASGTPQRVVTYNVTKDVTSASGDITWTAEAQNSTSANTLTLNPWQTGNFILGTSHPPFASELTPGTDYMAFPMTTDEYYSYGWFFIAPQKNKEKTLSGTTVVDGTELKNFHLTVTYDVYERSGTCTRRDAKVSNNLTFPSATVSEFKAGYYYNAYIMINPDFLYVLSDNDDVADVVLRAGS